MSPLTPLQTFFLPLKNKPWVFIRGLIVCITYSSFLLFSVWFVSHFQNALAAQDSKLLNHLLWQFVATIVVYYAIVASWRHWGITEMRPKYLAYIQNHAIRSLLLLPTEKFESY